MSKSEHVGKQVVRTLSPSALPERKRTVRLSGVTFTSYASGGARRFRRRLAEGIVDEPRELWEVDWPVVDKEAWSVASIFLTSVCAVRHISRRRTTNGSNKRVTVTVVPTSRGAAERDATEPSRLKVRLVPTPSSLVRVATERVEREARDDSASPRKPKERSLPRSSNELSFDVWWRCATPARLSFAMPPPLSETSRLSAPCSLSLTSILVAPASSAFSTSSLSAERRSTTTWSEQIRRAVAPLILLMAPGSPAPSVRSTGLEEVEAEAEAA
eukprot:scaffold253263_cov30-Tisochrysis_lutea.AAC.1